jgi:hypothetical protein
MTNTHTLESLTFTTEVRPVRHIGAARGTVITEIVTVTLANAEGRVTQTDEHAVWRNLETGRIVRITAAPGR